MKSKLLSVPAIVAVKQKKCKYFCSDEVREERLTGRPPPPPGKLSVWELLVGPAANEEPWRQAVGLCPHYSVLLMMNHSSRKFEVFII